jgi:hypothetical protein
VYRVIEGRVWRSEGTEANNFNAVYGAWPLGWQLFQAFAEAIKLAGRYQPETYCRRSGGFVARSLRHFELRDLGSE